MPESLPARMRIPKKPKKNKTWMNGFVLPPRMSDADILSMERAQRVRDIYNKSTKSRR